AAGLNIRQGEACMDTLDFLRLVWPRAGLYILSTPHSFTKNGEVIPFHKHHCFTTIEAAAFAATQMAQSNHVFYALGTVHNDYTHMSKPERDAQGVKIRGGENTKQVKAFW